MEKRNFKTHMPELELAEIFLNKKKLGFMVDIALSCCTFLISKLLFGWKQHRYRFFIWVCFINFIWKLWLVHNRVQLFMINLVCERVKFYQPLESLLTRSNFWFFLMSYCDFCNTRMTPDKRFCSKCDLCFTYMKLAIFQIYFLYSSLFSCESVVSILKNKFGSTLGAYYCKEKKTLREMCFV